MRRETSFKIIAIVIAIIAALAITEVTLRIFFKKKLYVVKDERNLVYQHDTLLGWFPTPNIERDYEGMRKVHISNNSIGFRGGEFVLDGRPVMLFLGDSYVWGYDVEQEERFTEKLQALMPQYQIFNMGVSGYGNDQSYLLLQRYFDTFKPEMVCLMFCTGNDHEDNRMNLRYAGYYKPYYTVEEEGIKLQGVPVPKSINYYFSQHPAISQIYIARLLGKMYYELTKEMYFNEIIPTVHIIKDMRAYLEERGASLKIGLQLTEPMLEAALTEMELPYVVHTTRKMYEGMGWHWTPEGHDEVANDWYKFLTAAPADSISMDTLSPAALSEQ